MTYVALLLPKHDFRCVISDYKVFPKDYKYGNTNLKVYNVQTHAKITPLNHHFWPTRSVWRYLYLQRPCSGV